ncbi:MAG: pentapeptide repeat-containing protein [Hyphomicrobiales bacterium]
MPYLRPPGRKLAFGNESRRWELSYAHIGIAFPVCLAVLLFSLLVATVPQACFWPFGEQSNEERTVCFSLDRTTARWWATQVGPKKQPRDVFVPTKWLFEGEPDQTSGTPDSLFSRNLIVTDKDLVAKNDFEEGETTLQIRGRDLRFAVLDRSDLRRANLFGSDLRGASAIATRLDHARFQKAKLQGANLREAKLQGANLREGKLQGANLGLAKLQGADLTGAKLQGADLLGAKLQGATLRRAELQGADLLGAKLQGADIAWAQMQGADLLGAKLQGATLGLAAIWQVEPPKEGQIEYSDLRGIIVAPTDQYALPDMLARLEDEALRKRVGKRLAALLDASTVAAWAGESERQAWSDFSSHSRPAPTAVAKFLVNLACTDDTGGYIIQGIARRISEFEERNERYAKLTARGLVDEKTCPAAKHLDEEALAKLRKTAARAEAHRMPQR